LSDVDGLISALDALIAKQRAIKQGAMQELLTGQRRLPGFAGEWEVKKLGEIAEISSGGTPDRKEDSYWNGTIPWITTSQIDSNRITAAEEFITEIGLANSSAKKFNKNTLLMAMYGQGKTRGKVAILGIDATINQACAAISIQQNISVEYIFFNLSQRYEEIRSLSNTGNQENLNGNIIKAIPILLPPPAEQTAIAQILADMDDAIAALVQKRAKTVALKQGMMQALLTGQVRLV
jgi:type I restriction enzyme S subunit